jgi:hypothetical protein
MAGIKRKSIQIIRKIGSGESATYPGKIAFVGNEEDPDKIIGSTSSLEVDDQGSLRFIKAALGDRFIDGLLTDPKTLVVDTIEQRNSLPQEDLYESRTIYVKKNEIDGEASGKKYMLLPKSECDTTQFLWGRISAHWTFDNKLIFTNPEWMPLTVVNNTISWDAGNRTNPSGKVVVSTPSVNLAMLNFVDASYSLLKIVKGTESDITVTFDATYLNTSDSAQITSYTIKGPTGFEAYMSFIKDGNNLDWNMVEFTQADRDKLGTIEVGAQKNLPFGNSANTVTEGNDPRLSDQRIPLPGSVDITKISIDSTIIINDIPITEQVKLEDANRVNWDYNGIYVGPPISGTKQGQTHSDLHFTYRCEYDNVWTRTPRV